ncbi:glycosyltransferase family 4 protein [Patescibacteria group bacterium]
MKHILIATGLYPPEIGGPATYSKLLENELPKHGFEVDVLPFSKVRHLPKIVRHIAYFFTVLWCARSVRLIIALDPVSVGMPAMFAAKLLRKKFILRVPGDYAWEQFSLHRKDDGEFITPDEFQKRKFDFITELRRKAEHLVARNAANVIAPGNYVKNIVKQWGVSEEKIIVIYSSFKPVEVKNTKEELRKKLNLSGRVILSAARLVPWKGMDTLINSVSDISKELSDIKLYIAGDGPERKKLLNLINSLNLKEHVFLLGRLSKEELFEYKKAADLFVLNTGYEAISHEILEVMALETPIVTTDAGDNAKSVEHDKGGIIINYNDKKALTDSILKILKDEELGKFFAKNAKERLGWFTTERTINSTVELLNRFF